MALDGDYTPSTRDFVRAQVDSYEATDGREANEDFAGRPCVILWTRGRTTGTTRKTPLIRVAFGGRYAAVASFAGAPTHPSWYLNLLADDCVSLQDRADLGDYTARTVEGSERDEWWSRAAGECPAYDEYQALTDRLIPVVVPEPRGEKDVMHLEVKS
jgi:F420H(2)-dependent quinone reductase